MSDIKEDLEEERRIIDAATAAGWRIYSKDDSRRGSCIETDWAPGIDEDTELITDWLSPGDAEFIVHARTALPIRNAQVEAVLEALVDEYNYDPQDLGDHAVNNVISRLRRAIDLGSRP